MMQSNFVFTSDSKVNSARAEGILSEIISQTIVKAELVSERSLSLSYMTKKKFLIIKPKEVKFVISSKDLLSNISLKLLLGSTLEKINYCKPFLTLVFKKENLSFKIALKAVSIERK